MKAYLIGVEGDFKRNAAEGVKRYMYELYKNLVLMRPNSIKKVEYKKLPLLYSGFSAFPQGYFKILIIR